jgi:hypothetical protein
MSVRGIWEGQLLQEDVQLPPMLPQAEVDVNGWQRLSVSKENVIITGFSVIIDRI